MLYLLHRPEDLEKVQKDILPVLSEKKVEQVTYPLPEDFSLQKDDLLLLFLGDKELRKFLASAGDKEWPIAILPHPENKYTSKGLGVSEKLKESLKEILEDQKTQQLDMLCCNGTPVFQSVNIGNIFALTEQETSNNIFSEFVQILKRIRNISSHKQQSFELSADGEKIISTSALGIVIVEHATGSVVSKRLVQDSSINDGNFHVFILAPQDLLSLIWFFLKSLWPRKKPLEKLPSFIGYIKTSNLDIKASENTEFTIDGEEKSSENVHLEVKRKAICLKQTSSHGEESKENGKKSLRVDSLPTGELREELIKRKLPILPRATAEQFQELFKVLRENAKVKSAFLVMMILSTLIAAFGLYGDSSPVIIGAMILAPIIAPIVSFSMGMVRYDTSMLKTGFETIVIGTLVCLAVAAGVSVIIPLKIITPEIEARLSPTLLDLGIAVASGIAAAYAHAKEGIAKSLAGVAIAVALVPPLSVAGIGLGWLDWQVFSGAILLYLTNLAGIILFAGLTFLLLGFAPFKRAKMGLIYTSLIIVLLAIPLSLSFNRIMVEARITRALEGITIEKVVLRDVRIRFGEPLVVSLKLVGPETVSPERIQEIKEEIEERIDQPVVLEVVSAVAF
ncbi:DUF389 domain-containing protein [Salinimicrobium soli]|uniref:DUF389 domain-containing protein n=1 Tax=Salinimicrobium soli TaxID=1254399 RepID=UPI003AAF626A